MLRDYFGNQIEVGSVVAYVVRGGSSHWVMNGTVEAINGGELKLARFVVIKRKTFSKSQNEVIVTEDVHELRCVTINGNREDIFVMPEGSIVPLIESHSYNDKYWIEVE